MINAEEILKNVRESTEAIKNNIIRGGEMLDLVCDYNFGNISRNAMKEILKVYIKQGCVNGKRTFQEAVKINLVVNYGNRKSCRQVAKIFDFFDYLHPDSIYGNHPDVQKEDDVIKLLRLYPKTMKINIKEFINDLDNIYDAKERNLANDDTTIEKWATEAMNYLRKHSENDIHRYEQEINGEDEIVPMTIDIDKINMEVPECLKN